MAEEIIENYSRFKGADWFPSIHKKEVMVLGAGGIGSWTALLLARLGCNLYIYDMDTYDITNMSGQFLESSAIGKNKAEALSELIKKTCDEISIETFGKYDNDSETHHIIFSCFDNMLARKTAFLKWFEYIKTLDKESQERKEAIFIDGRLLAEQWQLFCVRPNEKEINEYYKNHLFDDREVEELDCTFKQTSHCAVNLASEMTKQFVNHLYNVNAKVPFRKVNFFTEHSSPLLYTNKIDKI